MLLPIPEDVLQAQARDRAMDLLVGTLGVSAAVASASFAAYMAVMLPGGAAGPHRSPLVAVAGLPTHAPLSAPTPAPAAGDAAPPAGDIDFDPTGSIVPAAGTPPADAARAVLPDFAVRDAFDGMALVEAHGTLRMVQPGATIEGAGEVLSIARRGRGWVVATTGGLILQRR